jgi:hypothetical protein
VTTHPALCPSCGRDRQQGEYPRRHRKVKARHSFTGWWKGAAKTVTVYRPARRGLVIPNAPAANGLRGRNPINRSFMLCPDPWHAAETERLAAAAAGPTPGAKRRTTVEERRAAMAGFPERESGRAQRHRDRQSKDRR